MNKWQIALIDTWHKKACEKKGDEQHVNNYRGLEYKILVKILLNTV